MSHCSFRNIPHTSPAEDNAKLMSAVGHAGVSFTLQGKAIYYPF